MAANQTTMMGPNTTATVAVPRLCAANSSTRITLLIGTIHGSRSGAKSLRPSTADSTEMAGVMTASP